MNCNRRIILYAVLLTSGLCGCRRETAVSPASTVATAQQVAVGATPGLHNVQALSPQLLTGSSPEGDEGFRSLRLLGVRTIITVDGARPDVERARQFGMRYVHLPIGYDGVPRPQALRIARAIRDLPGPIYLHCHHGKHRAPAAAAVARLCVDEQCKVAEVIAAMKAAGTDPGYTGLYASPRDLQRPTRAELDAVTADFPEVSPISALADMMVRLDEHWERVTLARGADWQRPPAHPDVDPAHEALQVRELYHEMGRLTVPQSVEFCGWLTEAEKQAGTLEKLLRQNPHDVKQLEQAYRALQQGCKQCHRRYRDVPQSQ